jgi:hypothetical protein
VEEVESMSFEELEAATAAHDMFFVEETQTDELRFVMTRHVQPETGNISYLGYALEGFRIFSIYISKTGTAPNYKTNLSITKYETACAGGNNKPENDAVPVWRSGRWYFEVPKTPGEPLVMPLSLEYLVDGATFPVPEDFLLYAMDQVNKFPYIVITAATDSASYIIPVLFVSVDGQSNSVIMKCFSPTTGEIIALNFTTQS